MTAKSGKIKFLIFPVHPGRFDILDIDGKKNKRRAHKARLFAFWIERSYLITLVLQLAVLFFRLESAFASLTVTVSFSVVFALAVTLTVTATSAPVGVLLPHTASDGMLQDPATLPQEFFGLVMEQDGRPAITLHDSIA